MIIVPVFNGKNCSSEPLIYHIWGKFFVSINSCRSLKWPKTYLKGTGNITFFYAFPDDRHNWIKSGKSWRKKGPRLINLTKVTFFIDLLIFFKASLLFCPPFLLVMSSSNSIFSDSVKKWFKIMKVKYFPEKRTWLI